MYDGERSCCELAELPGLFAETENIRIEDLRFTVMLTRADDDKLLRLAHPLSVDMFDYVLVAADNDTIVDRENAVELRTQYSDLVHEAWEDADGHYVGVRLVFEPTARGLTRLRSYESVYEHFAISNCKVLFYANAETSPHDGMLTVQTIIHELTESGRIWFLKTGSCVSDSDVDV